MRNKTPEFEPSASDRDSTYDDTSESDIESVASHDSDYTNPSSSSSSGESSEDGDDDDDESSEDDGGDGGSNRKQMQARTEAVAAAATARAQGYWREDESEHEAKVGDVDHTQVKLCEKHPCSVLVICVDTSAASQELQYRVLQNAMRGSRNFSRCYFSFCQGFASCGEYSMKFIEAVAMCTANRRTHGVVQQIS